LPIPAAGVQPTAQVNVSAPGAALAGFQVSINGRFWVSTEAIAAWVRTRNGEPALRMMCAAAGIDPHLRLVHDPGPSGRAYATRRAGSDPS